MSDLKDLYKKRQKIYIENHKDDVICPICKKTVKGYYLAKHKKSIKCIKEKENFIFNFLNRLELVEENLKSLENKFNNLVI